METQEVVKHYTSEHYHGTRADVKATYQPDGRLLSIQVVNPVFKSEYVNHLVVLLQDIQAEQAAWQKSHYEKFKARTAMDRAFCGFIEAEGYSDDQINAIVFVPQIGWLISRKGEDVRAFSLTNFAAGRVTSFQDLTDGLTLTDAEGFSINKEMVVKAGILGLHGCILAGSKA